ncbi:endonuclease/exonuclease/phosphatase family protein [Streptomyces sp. Je 1-4]|uniref:endonuclease/exonuclease/phosphatase family protein n=1 Tax=Streptomyces TaxID=1883 RepID=UPI0021D83D59|nr:MULTISPECIES: endonuclease/exonuclease/phosphatase family protein [unclassified Streptomyces]UYB43475.1 endonuclease/exonuclease/phosphatase family protein [Streptomyces sp. Je 1-4]UZQ39855.1 endonuclease/exonuclease/phosphatase family protein [Streptomyces sp. Je 1-4] [Streptomyces sp. Je 1-4 4N24]UZQ47272.1 endonuclease/exonuclease/phosphatase family protein [Streptomyces sp. Je 1-4] [Streptomyces sp. Je 1-4 4N24_ara]
MVERADSDPTAKVTAAAPRRAWRRSGWWAPGEDAKRDARSLSAWTRGRALAALAVLTAGLLAFHRAVPNSLGRLGSLLEAFLPWLGLVVVVLLGLALLRRSATALVALLLPVAAWTYLFGGLLLPGAKPGAHDLVVVQHNAGDENTDPAGTARALADADPDLIALEELVPQALPVYENTLAPDYPYHTVQGTVGLWSKHPLTDSRLLDIKPQAITEPWSRGLRTVAHTQHGEIAVYVAHLPSVRLRASGLASSWRDESAALLGKAIAAEKLKTVILLGDLNGTVDDRGLTPLTSRMNVADRGFAFSFPAAFPLARIDQVMARSATVGHIRTLPATGSDHLPVAARITLEGGVRIP